MLSGSRPLRSTTGPADLLRMLAARGETMPAQLVLETHGDSWFGYELKPGRHRAPPETGQTANPILLQPPASKKLPENIRKPALKMPFAHLIVQREARELSESGASTVADPTDPLQPDDAAALAREQHWQIGFEDIVPAARLLPALRRHLGAVRSGRIDIDKLTDQLATSTLPARLPQRKMQRWHPDLVVLLDFSERLWPYRWDMHQLAERLLQVCGRSGVSLRIIQRGPLWRWSNWCAHQNNHLAQIPPEFSWTMPTAGTPVLLVSDLGLLLGPESSVCCVWREFIWQLRMAQLRPLALVPLGIEQLHAGLCRQLRVLRWSPDASAHPERVTGKGSTAPAGIDDLLAMVAATRRTDPPLLRAMRKLNPVAPMNVGLEGAAWCHSSVETGLAVTVKNDAATAPLQRFSEMPPDLQLKLNELRRIHHAHLRRVVEHEETLLWATHVSEATALAESKEIQTAVHFMERLTALLQLPGSDPGVWLQVANGIVHRAGSLMSKTFGDELRKPIGSALNDLLNGVIQVQGGKGSAPDWADPGQLPPGPEAFGWLVRDASSGYLLLQTQAPGQGQTGLGELLRLDQGVRIRRGNRYELCQANALPIPLVKLGQRTELELLTAHESFTIATVQRPLGAISWSVSRNGITVGVAAVAGAGYEIPESALACIRPSGNQPSGGWHLQSDAVEIKIGKQRITYGIDAPYGIYVDLHIQTRHGHATQRLRWIEPGTFLMGSPDSEPGHYDEERPQHPVTLTRGFWLADTACTQALWQAVTGGNLSQFKNNPQNPVEQVSWNDVQKFLRSLEGLLPGIEACLPSEAQWEYACRAGTETAYHFGNDITPEHVNYNGNTGKTVPVKSLPANDWGLYEMHGNVLEWCADSLRTYDEVPQQDPEGPADGARRAVRGGSWIAYAGFARSAYRYDFVPGSVFDVLGFRLCLRSSGQVRPGGPSGASRAQRATDFFSRPGKSGDKRKK